MDSKGSGTVLVAGAGGFIGGYMTRQLLSEGHAVRAVDIKPFDQWYQLHDAADNRTLDLREKKEAFQAAEDCAAVYNFAADMGGMGFISVAECEVLRNNALINIHMAHTAATMGVPRYFFSSSVCVYRDMQPGEPALTEDDAIPANPDNEYGWEKLYAERVAMAYGRHTDMNVRIARFQNCYGPEGTLRQAQGRPGAADARRPRRPFAARWPWPKTALRP